MRGILLADDEFIIRKGIRELLDRERAGFAIVAEARSGKEAVDMFAKLLPGIVVMDIRMPGMTGLEAFAEMRKASAHTQAIFISAFTDPLYLRGALRSEAVDYLFKPIDPAELLAALLRADGRLLRLGIPPMEAEQPAGRSAAAEHAVSVMRGYIEAHYAQPLTAEHIADAVHLSTVYACTLYKRATGETVLQYLTQTRLEAAQNLLRTTELPIYAIAQRVGYRDYRHFKQLFHKHAHMSPAAYRAQPEASP